MAIRIEESFQVDAPVEEVWSFLIEPERVVKCLPGASLAGSTGERSYEGTVKVKVGPVTATYKGTVEFTEVDEESHRVTVVGEGMEKAGGGQAKMTMVSTVTALPDGGSEVRVEQDVEVVGKLAQFGRGMVQEVGKQLFSQFTDCARKRLEEGSGGGGAGGGEAGAAAAGEAGDSAAATGEGRATGAGGGPGVETGQDDEGDEPVAGLGLALRALWSLITRPFRSGK